MSTVNICLTNNYLKTQYALSGCNRDADLWASKTGVKPLIWINSNDITKDDVIQKYFYAALKHHKETGDTITFLRSGHGMSIPSSQEPDGYQECWVVAINADGSYVTITDNELKDLLNMFPIEACVTMIDDSCHSGGEARGFQKVKSIGAIRDVNISKAFLKKKIKDNECNFAYIAACTEGQTASDATFNGKANGAHIYYYSKCYSKNKTRKQIFNKECKYLPSWRFAQQPQLFGNAKIYNEKFNY